MISKVFRHNKIWSLNVSLFLSFKELRSLDLSFNNIDNTIVNTGLERLSSLKKLEMLNLSHNYIENGIFPSLGALNSLKILDLSFNKLNGDFPAYEFAALENLEVLMLAGVVIMVHSKCKMDAQGSSKGKDDKRNEQDQEMTCIGEIEEYISLSGEKRAMIPTRHLRRVINEELGKSLKIYMPPIITELKKEMRNAVKEEFLKLKNVLCKESEEEEKIKKSKCCKICGKNHKGRCKYDSEVCQTCGTPGHLSEECVFNAPFCEHCGNYEHDTEVCPNKPT